MYFDAAITPAVQSSSSVRQSENVAPIPPPWMPGRVLQSSNVLLHLLPSAASVAESGLDAYRESSLSLNGSTSVAESTLTKWSHIFLDALQTATMVGVRNEPHSKKGADTILVSNNDGARSCSLTRTEAT
jgi:hypothetical protein